MNKQRKVVREKSCKGGKWCLLSICLVKNPENHWNQWNLIYYQSNLGRWIKAYLPYSWSYKEARGIHQMAQDTASNQQRQDSNVVHQFHPVWMCSSNDLSVRMVRVRLRELGSYSDFTTSPRQCWGSRAPPLAQDARVCIVASYVTLSWVMYAYLWPQFARCEVGMILAPTSYGCMRTKLSGLCIKHL